MGPPARNAWPSSDWVKHAHAPRPATLSRQAPQWLRDAKKKELAGAFKNGGREYSRPGSPSRSNAHDFPDKELGKASPYGVYDVSPTLAA